MSKYQEAKIYKVYCPNSPNEYYIGSTCDKTLARRMAIHRYDYKSKERKNSKALFDLFDKYGIENCKIELIENYECTNKDELSLRLKNTIRTSQCVNTVKKRWREINKDKLNEKNDCPCGGKYTHKHKAEHMKSKKHQEYMKSELCINSDLDNWD